MRQGDWYEQRHKGWEAQCKFGGSECTSLAAWSGLGKDVVGNEARVEVWGLFLEGFEEQNVTLIRG